MKGIIGRNTKQLRGLALAATFVLGCIGCGQGDRPDLGTVEGVVTLDGKPLADAIVQFDPGTVRGSTGMTDTTGHYELTYIRDTKGAAIGKHTVRISTQTETKPETLLPRYNAKTELTATVQPGPNEIDFELKSQ